jgi:hypothetical protein
LRASADIVFAAAIRPAGNGENARHLAQPRFKPWLAPMIRRDVDRISRKVSQSTIGYRR